MEMIKEKIMNDLGITENDLKKDKHKVVEKLFCASLLTQNTDVIANVTNRFLELRETLFGKGAV